VGRGQRELTFNRLMFENLIKPPKKYMGDMEWWLGASIRGYPRKPTCRYRLYAVASISSANISLENDVDAPVASL